MDVLLKKLNKLSLSQEQFFMIAMLLVNGGNYLYNLFLGRVLGPSDFSDAAILITLLLVLSFVGMTFQIVAAKYVVLFEGNKQQLFIKQLLKYAVSIGVIAAVIIGFSNSFFQNLFDTQTSAMFGIFAIGLPLYFIMSINRGVFQGKDQLNRLSTTYLLEMMSRLSITALIIYLLPTVPPSILVAIGILLSIISGLFPIKELWELFAKSLPPIDIEYKEITSFFMIMAFYELTQIIINNSDIILVTSYFESYDAGVYASLALIGRAVYFIAWLFVMLLLPKVIALHKEGKATYPLLFKNVLYIAIISCVIVFGTYLFPEMIVKILFGNAYLIIAPLLWKYALATSLFALSNIFVYYFLSINQYIPVGLAAIFAGAQVVLLVLYHKNLEQVVSVQVVVMVGLLIIQLLFFVHQYYRDHSSKKINHLTKNRRYR